MSTRGTTLRRRHGPANALLFLTVLPITPLVDVSLVLLVFMIAAADLGRTSQAPTTVPVALPKAGTGQATPTQPLTVVVDRAGRVQVAGAEVAADRLGQLARGARQAVIQADAKVEHGTVVGVVDVLRRAGVQDISYATVSGAVEW